MESTAGSVGAQAIGRATVGARVFALWTGACLAVVIGTAPVRAFDVQGHRGARGLVPENTLPAFNAALDLRVDTLELDLHLSRDGEVVVSHDPLLSSQKCHAVPPGSTAEAALAILTLAQIQAGYICDRNPEALGRFPAQDNTYARINGGDEARDFQTRRRFAVDVYSPPSLREVFEFVGFYSQHSTSLGAKAYATRVRFNIELKRIPTKPANLGSFEPQFEAKVVALVREYGLQRRITVQSFVHDALRQVQRLDRSIATVALTSAAAVSDPGGMARAAGAQVWSPDYQWNTADLTRRSHSKGVSIIPYTVDDPKEIADELDKGVDGLITDFPNRILCNPVFRKRIGRTGPLPPGCLRFPAYRF